MSNYIYDIIFFFISVFILIRAISYGIYEIKQKNNKIGGIVVISFSSVVVAFANLMVILRL